MVLPAHQRKRAAHELEDIRLTANGLKLVDGAEIVDKRDGVDRQVAIVHVMHSEEQRFVRRTIKVVGKQFNKRFLDHLARKQHGGQNICLCLYVVWKGQLSTSLNNPGGLPCVIAHGLPRPPLVESC